MEDLFAFRAQSQPGASLLWSEIGSILQLNGATGDNGLVIEPDGRAENGTPVRLEHLEAGSAGAPGNPPSQGEQAR